MNDVDMLATVKTYKNKGSYRENDDPLTVESIRDPGFVVIHLREESVMVKANTLRDAIQRCDVP